MMGEMWPPSRSVLKSCSPRYANYVLTLLCCVYGLNFVDRQILNIMIDPIKAHLHVSDTDMGLLTGFGFATFYALFSIPVARWSDRGNRRLILTLALSIWSLMTALSGIAQTFWQLACARICVGIGETGGTPTSYSLIADYFPHASRAKAVAIFEASIYAGVLCGYLIGGWVSEFYGWRAAFMIVGLPGLLVSGLFYGTVREPAHGMSESRPVHSQEAPPLGECLQFMGSQPSLVFMTAGLVLLTFVFYALGAWVPSFLRRLHDMSGGELGTWLGFVNAVPSAIGTLLGGLVVGRVKSGAQSWILRWPAMFLFASVPFMAIFLLARSASIALLAYSVANVLTSFPMGPCFAAVLSLSRVRMRTLAAAIVMLFCNLIGGGLGPLFVGATSDALTPRLGVESIRWSLLAMCTALVLAGLCFWVGSYFVRHDLQRTEHADMAPEAGVP